MKHFLIRHGDGNWTEYKSDSNVFEFTFVKYDQDDEPIIMRRQSPKNRFLKLTTSLAVEAFDKVENLNNSLKNFSGYWEPRVQLGFDFISPLLETNIPIEMSLRI